jgi:DNA-binding MarR family transcriptional regulator
MVIISLTDDQLTRSLVVVSNDQSDVIAERLGYLLKHAQQRFSELTATRFAPLGITGREAAVLRTVASAGRQAAGGAQPAGRAQPAGDGPSSQGEVARLLGVDRTTMVALIDELQDKGLVLRRQDPGDRRKNAVELTDAGRGALRQADEAADEVEQAFLAPLTAGEAEQFRRALQALVFNPEQL